MAARSFDDELEQLFDRSLNAVFIAGLDGHLRRVNRGFARLLGYSHEEFLARPFLDNVHPDDVEAVRAALAELAAGQDLVAFESRQVTADGWVRWMEWHVTPRLEEGVAVGIGLDVTDRHVAMEQVSALRRVATLVAEAPQPHDLFALVAAEVARVVDVPAVSIASYDTDDSVIYLAVSQEGEGFSVGMRQPLDGTSVVAEIRRTHKPARVDDYSGLDGTIAELMRRSGGGSTVGSPIVVAGRLWGAMVVSTPAPEPLPPDTEARLTDFTELLGAAIANAESRDALERVAQEQAALRRVATLAVQRAHTAEIFSAVTHEVGQLFGENLAAVGRYDADARAVTIVGIAGDWLGFEIGTHVELTDETPAGIVYSTGRAARVDRADWGNAHSEVGKIAERLGVVSSVACPIIVEGRLWGLMSALATTKLLPADTEQRLQRFTALVATAIANAESREALERLADEQAALRRVATLVAQGVPPVEIFSAVSVELDRLFGLDQANVGRFDPSGPAFVVVGAAADDERIRIGSRWEIDELYAASRVFLTGRSARVDEHDLVAVGGPVAERLMSQGILVQLASPITVNGHFWGVLSLTAREPLPSDAADRLERFSELVATAIANAESREALERLAEEQSALRRAATMVVEGAAPEVIYSAVSDEIGRLFSADTAAVVKFEHDPPSIVVVGVGATMPGIPVGTRSEFDDSLAVTQVYRTGRSARLDARDFALVPEPFRESARRLDLASSVVSPITVEGRLWGATTISATTPFPLGTETRLERFSDLLATAIANAESKSELAASRRRIVAASDEARRQIERDLHDGTQQRLVALGLAVRTVEADVPPERDDLRSELSRIATGLSDAITELQEMSRGIHPVILSKGGLAAALRALARRSTVPIHLDVTTDARPAEPIEVAAYYVASEAIANATKHAHASRIDLSFAARNGGLQLSIRDDGVGGADPRRGSGLVGLSDRVEAVGGSIRVESARGRGTRITAELPLDIEPQR